MAYWFAYLLIFSIVEGIPANAFGTAFLSEATTMLPKIVFVTIVVSWLMNYFTIDRNPVLFASVYFVLLLLAAFVLRIVDNYIVLPYLLPHWHKEPLLSAAPFLYNVVKLQFLVMVPLIAKLLTAQTETASKAYGQIKALVGATEIPARAHSYLQVVCDRRMVSISLEDIRYFETRGNYILIYTENECLKTYLSISKLQEQLPANMFVRVHRSFIVSLKKVSWFNTTNVMVDETKIPISRSFGEQARSVLMPMS